VGYKFEWDPDKAEANDKKHGVSFEEGISVFGDPLSMNMSDRDHSEDERRYIVLGVSDRHRVLVVCYAEIEERTRLISARRATRSERNSYEEE